MAFDYGSIDLGITNPFRVEGAIRATSGVPMVLLGVFGLLGVQTTMQEGARDLAIYSSIASGILLVWGLQRVGRGLFQVFRFFVGRSVPANLAPNFEKSQSAKPNQGESVYTDQQLEQMLQGRQNISFHEPSDWFSRLIHSLFRKLLYLPYAYRNLAQRLARAVTQTAIAALSYALAWFSGTTGITNVTQTPVMDWLALVLLGYLLFIWSRASPPLARLLREDRLTMPSTLSLALWIVGAIAAPVILATLHESAPLPVLAISTSGHLFLTAALAMVSTIVFFSLLTARSNLTTPAVEVAEYRDNWQESIHPQEIFINLENIVMANRRYKEVPNRIYRGFKAELFEQGSDDKGEFDGELIQETQPVFHQMAYSRHFQLGRFVATAAAASLAIVVALLIYNLPDKLAGLTELTGAEAETAISAAAGAVIVLIILAIFARMLSHFSHAFWAEMQFQSLLVYFQCRGTYTASKLSTGTSIYDSTRSENVVVRSSMTPWVIATRAISSTFATSGALNLELARYVLEMHKAEAELEAIINDLRGFMKQREAIASINNEQDLAAASRIFQVNQQTRAQLENQPQSAHPPLDTDRISEASGEEPLN